MLQNKKSQAMMILKIMIGIIVLIMAVAFIAPVKESIDINTNTSEFNCTSTTLTNANQAACIVTDFSLFYILGSVISVGMAFIAGRKNISGVITAIVIFVLVVILINPLKDIIIYARDASHLNCASGTISVATRLSCILFDIWLFWFVIIVLSAAITYIFIKKVMPLQQ